MKAKNVWMTVAAVSLSLAAAAWAGDPEGREGPGFGMRGERGGPMFRGPGEHVEVMAARRECREAARQVRKAATEEERETAMALLREKVKAEVELVDRLQEERLDAIEKAAAQRMAALRAQLAEMRAHQAEFIEQEVKRLSMDRRGGHGPEGEPPEMGEAPEGWMPPPPPPEEEGEGCSRRHGGFRHPGKEGRRGPWMGGPGRRGDKGCGEGPRGEPPEEKGSGAGEEEE